MTFIRYPAKSCDHSTEEAQRRLSLAPTRRHRARSYVSSKSGRHGGDESLYSWPVAVARRSAAVAARPALRSSSRHLRCVAIFAGAITYMIIRRTRTMLHTWRKRAAASGGGGGSAARGVSDKARTAGGSYSFGERRHLLDRIRGRALCEHGVSGAVRGGAARAPARRRRARSTSPPGRARRRSRTWTGRRPCAARSARGGGRSCRAR